MTSATDHTHEVERRVAAIHVRATDTCGFFITRKTALIPRQECWYCAHGDFKRDTNDPHQPGLCKFKK